MNEWLSADFLPDLQNFECLQSELAHLQLTFHEQKQRIQRTSEQDICEINKHLPKIRELAKEWHRYCNYLQVLDTGYMTFEGRQLEERSIPQWRIGERSLLQWCGVLSSYGTSLTDKRVAAKQLVAYYNTYLLCARQPDQYHETAIKRECNPLIQQIEELKARISEFHAKYPDLKKHLCETDKSLRDGVEVETVLDWSQGIVIPIGADLRTYEGKQYFVSLKTWDLRRPLLIHDHTLGGNDSNLDCFLKDIALRFLHAYPFGALCLDFVEGNLNRLRGEIPAAIESVSEDHGILALDSLESWVRSHYGALGASYNDMFAYNRANPTDPHKLVLTFVDDHYLRRWDDSRLNVLLQYAYSSGMFFVFVSRNTDNEYNRARPIVDTIDTYRFTYCPGEEKNILQYEGGQIDFCLRTSKQRSDRELCEVLPQRAVIKSLLFEEVIESFRPQKRQWEEISIPYGQANGNLKLLNLNATSAHTMILGSTGSGKSNLLNALILGAAYHYSPADCQIIIVDGEKALGKKYMDAKLPHLYCAVDSTNPLDLYTFWNWLNEQKDARTRLFQSRGCDDFVAYNEKMPEKDRIPRLIIVLDEFSSFTNLFANNEALKTEFISLVNTSRSAGISLIVSIVNLTGLHGSDNMIAQFAHKFELRADALQGSLIGQRIPSSHLPRKGDCFYSGGGTVEKVRIAYLEDCNQNILAVRKKYSEYSSVPINHVTDGDPWGSDAWIKSAREEYKQCQVKVPLGTRHFFESPRFVTFNTQMPVLSIWGNRRQSLHLIKQILNSGKALSSAVGTDPLMIYGDFVIGNHEDEWRTYLKSLSFPVALNRDELNELFESISSMVTARQSTGNAPSVLVILAGINRWARNARERYLDFTEWINLIQKAGQYNIFFLLHYDGLPSNQTNGFTDYMNNVIFVSDQSEINEFERNQLLEQVVSQDRSRVVPVNVIRALPSDRIIRRIGNRVDYIKPYYLQSGKGDRR